MTTTAEIREEVDQHCPSPRAKWPNGLGYTWRGWEYSFNRGCWHAVRATAGNTWYGRGETPADAKANAFPQPA